jgi:hypothetical protein
VIEEINVSDSTAAGREILRAGNRSYSWSQVLAGAYFRGDAAALDAEVGDALAAVRYAEEEGFEIPEDAGEAGDAFRLEHELITGEEMERWLAHVGITLEQFDGHFASRLLLARFREELDGIRRDYAPAAAEILEAMWAATILSGCYDALTAPFARRLAAWCAGDGRSDAAGTEDVRRLREAAVPVQLCAPGLVEELAGLEVAYAAEEAGSATPELLARELHSQRFQLMRLDYAEAVYPTANQAQEAYLAVSADGRPFEQIAEEAGVETTAACRFPDEMPDPPRSVLFSAAPGAVLKPEAVEGGFVLHLLRRRIEPDLADPAVADRVRERLIAARFDALVARHVAWSFDPWTAG